MTDDDILRKRGEGPKPKDERRRRIKKEVVKKTSKTIVQPYIKQFEWRTRDVPPGEPRGGRAGWRPKPRQPTDRTLEEAVVEGFLSNPKRRLKE